MAAIVKDSQYFIVAQMLQHLPNSAKIRSRNTLARRVQNLERRDIGGGFLLVKRDQGGHHVKSIVLAQERKKLSPRLEITTPDIA